MLVLRANSRFFHNYHNRVLVSEGGGGGGGGLVPNKIFVWICSTHTTGFFTINDSQHRHRLTISPCKWVSNGHVIIRNFWF